MAGVDTGAAVSPADSAARAGLARIEVVPSPHGRSVLTRAYATSPLRLLTPRNRGLAAWVYLSSYGGGLVGGDDVGVEVHVREGAALYLSTQASTKIYRSGLEARSALQARIEAGATMIALPDPVVCFAGSTYRQLQSFDMQGDASLVLVDWMSAGRLASGERWAFDEYATRLRLHVDGVLAVYDATVLRAADGQLHRRMGRFDVLATVIVYGRRLAAQVAGLLEQVSAIPVERRPVHVSAAPIGEGGCLVRLAGGSTERIAQTIREYLRFVPDLLGDDPWIRKW
jgi:urease accessory protein